MTGVLESISKSISRIEEFTRKDEFGEVAMEQATVRRDKLEEFYGRFVLEHQKVLESDPRKAKKMDEIAAVVERCYFAAKAALTAKIKGPTPACLPAPSESQPLAVQVNIPFRQHDMKNTWGEFDGTLTKWLGFRDRFVAAIHENDNISAAYKFAYLRKSLIGRAAKTLGEWQLTDANYAEAWERLSQIYDRKYPICREHLRKLLRLPVIANPPRPNDLQKMSNVTHEVLRQLRAQEVPVDTWDMIVVHLLHERLDPETSKQWELQRQTESPTIKQMLDFLDRQARALSDGIGGREVVAQNRPVKFLKGNRGRDTEKHGGNQVSGKAMNGCTACNGNHPIWHCDEFKGLNLRARENIIQKYKICRNCLKIGHFAENCFQKACIRCPGEKKHNSLLCPNNGGQKQALMVKGQDKRPKKRKFTTGGHVYAAQTESGDRHDTVNEELRAVDRQIDLLEKKEQLLAKRKCLVSQNIICSSNKSEEINSNQNYVNFINFEVDKKPALLPTVLIRLETNGRILGPVRALLDCGAQPSLITYSFYEKNKFPTCPTTQKMFGIEGESFYVSRRAILRIRPWFNKEDYVEEEFLVLPKTSKWEPILPDSVCKLGPSLDTKTMPLADPEYWKPAKVQVVLNVKVFAKIMIAVESCKFEGMVYINTHLGIVVCGSQDLPSDDETDTANSFIGCTNVEDLGELVKRFWQLDQVSSRSMRTDEEEMVEKIFLETYTRDLTGRFTVSIPIKADVKDIGSSKETALRRFFALEKRLSHDLQTKQQYVEFMREYERLGHMEPVGEAALPTDMVYYIPHHCVTKKFRVVFDASCHTDKGISLNDVQMLGEKLQRDLAEIIMRFRRHKIGIVGDIKMMFRQIAVEKGQWNLQRIFWRESTDMPVREYWLKVVTYGLTSSAFNAVRSLIQCARDASDAFPEAANVIENDFYMDDCITGSESESRAVDIAKDIQYVLRGAGFEMRKWKSNCKYLMDEMRSEEEDTKILVDEEKATVLGLTWNISLDQFSFVVRTLKLESPVTKRKILGLVAQLYDPNGFISPVTIMGKIIIQDLWRIGSEWDEPVSKEIEERFREYWEGMAFLEQFYLLRWIGSGSDQNIELHGFSDASTVAYGAVIYARVGAGGDEMKAKTTLLVSKSRVAPMKTITVPRLELAAAELLSRMLTEVIKAMELPSVNYTLWTDSQVVLHWIRKIPRNLKTFVANRVSSIQTNTDVQKWRYINTNDNPADLVSRGMKPKEIISSSLWTNGPVWLRENPELWPDGAFVPNTGGDVEVELKTFTVAASQRALQIAMRTTKDRVNLIEYVDKLERAVGVIAYILKFIANTRLTSDIGRRRRGCLTKSSPSGEHRIKAMHVLLRQEQERYFSSEIRQLEAGKQLPYKSKIESLKPELRDGLLRVHGRLKNSNLDENMRHPVIVPDKSRLAYLIMDHAHRETKHGGVQVMMQYIRKNYWIPRLRSALRSFLHKCVTCARHNHRVEVQLMADLPSERVQPGKPFLHSGVDYAGPIVIKMIDKEGRQMMKQKVWIAVFVCLKSRAVHLDMVTDLTTIAFIACYERFIARRGRCERIYSDNGTAFVGAAKEIKRATERWYKEELFQHLIMKGTEWRFMTPAAPHQGGIYEAAVKSMKYHLIRVIGMRMLHFEQLSTLLAQIEAVLNSRPLHPLNDDPADMQALTPGHLLIGEPLILPLPFHMSESSSSKGVKYFEERRRMLQSFWERWQNEYLTTLQERKKWRRESERVQVGQLVLLKSENFPPAQWAMGRVTQLHHSKDNLVRSVTVQTPTNILRRPVQKICILPIENADK